MAPKRPQWQKHAAAFLNERLERGVSCASFLDLKGDLISYVTAKGQQDVPGAKFSDARGAFRRWTEKVHGTMDAHLVLSRLLRIFLSRIVYLLGLEFVVWRATLYKFAKLQSKLCLLLTLPQCALKEAVSALTLSPAAVQKTMLRTQRLGICFLLGHRRLTMLKA